jgi:DNA-directed RNA polymerase specialized sigma24 family protein
MDTVVEQRLLEAARRGDGSALGTLLIAHRGFLFTVAYARTRQIEMAEDAAIEALKEAWRQRKRLRLQSATQLRSWLCTVALRQAARHLNASRKMQSEPVLHSTGLPPDPHQLADVLRAIDDLPLSERLVLMLKIRDQHTSAEVAGLLSETDQDDLTGEFAAWPPDRRAVDNKYEQALRHVRRTVLEGVAR